ncbi:MAG: hypothetical protein E6H92_07145 [Chloroflexi bacterium]|nr:MAG: hypothetical protein E6H92_07145 [Chloroflexota bacterium]
MKGAPSRRGHAPPLVRWLWPLPLLLIALLAGPLRARADYPGMPCSAGLAGLLQDASYAALFVPVGVVLVLLGIAWQRAQVASRRPIAAGFAACAALVAIGYLALGNILWLPARAEHLVSCPASSGGYQPVRCWTTDPPNSVFEMNATGQRPLSASSLVQLARALAAHRSDAYYLYQAFVLNTTDANVTSYPSGWLFVLSRADQSPFGSGCLQEAQLKDAEFQSHRVGFYRYSAQQSPPVDAFFLQDAGPNGEAGYEVIDFRHGGEALAYVRPDDLLPAESQYLDRVSAGLATLNTDLDKETQSAAPAGALGTMRQDFTRVTADLAINVPPRLKAYQQGRLRRFLENYDLILAAEESTAQGRTGQAIHTSAYEQHRTFYYQEPRITRLIGYLYIQESGQVAARNFTDDELSSVNWAVF